MQDRHGNQQMNNRAQIQDRDIRLRLESLIWCEDSGLIVDFKIYCF